jgi:hypothetical protein
MADRPHPNHRAMIVEAGGGAVGSALDRYGFFGLWEGGAFNLASGVGWFSQSGSKTKFEESGDVSMELLKQLPIVDLVRKSGAPPTDYEDFVSHPPEDPWWQEQPFLSRADGFSVPGLHVNSWFDMTVDASIQLATASGAPDTAEQKLIVSPAAHCMSEEFGDENLIGELPVTGAKFNYAANYRAFYDKWLKGGTDTDLPVAQIFMLGANQWLEFDSWLPAQVRSEYWYLTASAGAQSRYGDGRLQRDIPGSGMDTYVYDPTDPVATRGGPHCCTGDPQDQPGSFDQTDSAERDDVLVFESEPLQHQMRIAGPLTVALEVSTSARDTDFTAKLIDVWPDGRAFNLQDGVFRLRYRDGFNRVNLASPEEKYEINIRLSSIAYEFLSGHRLRLEVSSSNFPRIARNLNTGGPNHAEVEPVVATNSVYYGKKTALKLPVLPESAE